MFFKKHKEIENTQSKANNSVSMDVQHRLDKLEALEKVAAVIEFDPDGNILSANSNFLKTMGYRLDEIQGKHHSIFCGPEITNSREYKDFWETLKSGQSMGGQFQRVRKDGKKIWLEASYNPLIDKLGNVYGVVKTASDITDFVTESNDQRGIVEAVDKSMAIIEFDLSGNVLKANRNFLDSFGYTIDQIKGKHHRMFCSKELAESPEYRQMWQQLNRGEFVAGVFERVHSSGSPMWLGGNYNPVYDNDGKLLKVVKIANDITQRVNSENEATEAVYSTSIETEQVSKQANAVLNDMLENMNSVAEEVKAVATNVSDLNNQSEKINSIVSTISAIADQTNLLALNAAIEAARAGEQGRGFAVVADEVRNLAARTSNSTAEINEVVNANGELTRRVSSSISSTQDKAGQAVELIQQVVRVIEEINQGVQNVVKAVEQRSGS